MHIVLLCGYYYPDTVGGTEAYVHMLGQDLQERGHNITVAAPATGSQIQRYTHEGIEVVRYPVSEEPSRDELRREAPPACLSTWEDWLQRTRPDVVHMHSLTRGCSVFHAQAVTQRDIPLFVTVHVPEVTCPRGTMMRWGSVPCDGEIRPTRCGACVFQKQGLPRSVSVGLSAISRTGIGRWLPGKAGTGLQRASLIKKRKTRLQKWFGHAEHVVVVAEWLKEVLLRNGISEDHVTVSRHGLSGEMISTQGEAAKQRRPRDSERPLRVGFVGRFTPIKGAHVLVEAVRRLSEDVALILDLYGLTQGSDDREYLQTLKRNAEGDSRIRFQGPLTADNRVEAFASFDVLAVPSVGFETGPLTVLEAFAAEIPVVGSNQGGIAERVNEGENGMLVPAGDLDQWKKVLREVSEDYREDEWSWKIPQPRSSGGVAEKMEQFYKNRRATR